MKMNTKYTFFILKLIAALTIAFVIIYNLDTVELTYILKNADWTLMTLAVLLLPLNLYLQFIKWRYLVQKVSDEKIPDRQILSSVFIGISFGFVTPGKVGELGKLFVISNVNKLKMLSMGILEKIYDVFPVLIFGIISIPFLPHLFFTDSVVMRFNLMVFSLIVSLFCYFIAVHPGLFKSLLNYFKNNILNNNEKFRKFSQGIEGFGTADSRKLLLMSSLLFIVYTGQFALLILAFGDLDIFHVFFGVWASVLIKTFLPVSLGDIGVREGTAAYIFGLMNFSHEAAVSAAFLLFVINILLPSAAGVFLIPFSGLMSKYLKK